MSDTPSSRQSPRFSVSQRAGGLVRVTHPVPVAMYMLLMALLAPIAAFSAHLRAP